MFPELDFFKNIETTFKSFFYLPDLSFVIQSASMPPTVIEEVADRVVSGVSEAAALLNEIVNAHLGATRGICEELRP